MILLYSLITHLYYPQGTGLVLRSVSQSESSDSSSSSEDGSSSSESESDEEYPAVQVSLSEPIQFRANEQIKELRQEVYQLEFKVGQQNVELERIQKEYSQLKTQYQALVTKAKTEKPARQSSINRQAELSRKLTEAENEAKTLRVTLEENTAGLKAQKAEVRRLNAELKQARTAESATRHHNQKQQGQVNELSRQKDKAERLWTTADTETGQLKEANKKLSEEKLSVDLRGAQYKSDNDALKKQL